MAKSRCFFHGLAGVATLLQLLLIDASGFRTVALAAMPREVVAIHGDNQPLRTNPTDQSFGETIECSNSWVDVRLECLNAEGPDRAAVFAEMDSAFSGEFQGKEATVPTFSYAAVSHGSLAEAELPPGSTALDGWYSLYRTHRSFILGMGGLFVFQWVVISLLLLSVLKRRGVERELQKSEAKYRSIFENAVEGMYQTTLDGRFLSASPSLAAMLGYDSAEELIQSINDIGKDLYINPEDRTRFIEEIKQCDVVTGFEQQFRRKDGSILWVSLSAKSHRDERGELIGLEGFSIDITDRKRAEEALRKTEERYRAFVANSSEGIWRCEAERPIPISLPVEEQIQQAFERAFIAECNDANARMYGFDRAEELVGARWGEMVTHDPRNVEFIRAFIESGYRLVGVETVERDRQGRVHHFANSMIGVVEDGHLVGAWGVQRDITAQKQAEEALRQANLVAENSPAVLFRWRAAEGWPVEMVSRNVDQFGYRPEELLSGVVPFASIVHPEDLARVAAEVQEYSAKGIDRFQQEYRIVAKDGEVRWVDDRTLVERNADGQITHYQGIAIDITERKRTEEALLQEKHFTETLIDSMPGMFYVFDQQGRVVRWNKQLERYTGHDADSISTANAIDFIHPEDREAVAKKIQEVFVRGESHVEGRVLAKDGGSVPFYLTGLRIAIGDTSYLLGVGLDISERVRAEAESARLQTLLRSVIMQSPVPMVLVLPDGKVELFNDGCRSVLGVQEELQLPPDLNLFTLEQPWIDYTAEGVPISLEDLPLTLALRGKTTRSREMKIVRQDGSERWILVDAVPVLDAQGTVIAGFLVFVDITERKCAQEALTASQEFLSSIIENIPNMIFVKDAKELRFTRFNKAGEELLGYRREELIGKNDYDFFNKEQADSFTNMDRKVLESGQVLDIPGEAIDTAAGRRILHTKKIPLMDKRGNPAYLLGISEDITERVKAEEALRTSEANLQLAFEAGRLGDWSWDIVAGEVYWSDRCKALYGVSPDAEMTYDGFLKLVHPEDRALVDAALRQAVATKGDYNVEKRVIWPDGSVHWNATLGRVFCNAEGHPVRVTGVTLDITERKQAEMELLGEKQFIEKLLESLPGIFFLYDSTLHLKRWNKAHETDMGFTADELRDWYISDWHETPEEAAAGVAFAQSLLETGVGGAFETTLINKEGRFVPYLISITRLMTTEGPFMMGVGIDITERKRIEEKLAESIRQLRTVVDGAPIVLYSFDRNGVFTLSEGKGLVGLGIKPGEIVGKTIDEVYGDQPASIAALRRAMAGETFTLELSFPAGGIFEVSHTAMHDEAGDYNGTIGVLVDMTERKRAEDALRKSEQRFRAIFNSTFQFTGVMSSDGILIEANQAALDFAGAGLDEVINRPFWETRWWQGDEARVRQLREAISRAAAGEFVRYEVELQGAGEATAFIDFSLKPVFDADSRVTLLIPEGRDITERKRAEEALRDSEERYRLLFSSINDAVFVHKLDSEGSPGRLIEVNDVACRRLGYTRDELLQMLPTDVDAPDALDLLPVIMERLSAEGHAVWEGVHVTKDGRRIPVEISDRLFELRGETIGLATVRDISERKQAEEENRRLRNYLANIIDSMPSVLVGVDTGGRVTQWNAAAQRRTGISSEEAFEQPVEQVLPILSGELDKVKQAIRSRMVKSENRVPKVVDGQMQYLDVTVYPLVSNGLEGAVIRVDDVTERVQIEEMMIQSEKMLSVGGLAAGMAHEINNPLGAILQASQNIVRRVSPDLLANFRAAEACGTTLDVVRRYLEQREILSFLEDIRSSGLRAAQIVDNMLAFSRKSEAGGSSTNLAELLDRTLVLAASDYDLKKRYDFRQIEIVRDYSPDTPLVICQPGKIQQVFFNILRNGAEAMRETRDVGRVPRLILRVLPEGHMVRVEIEDNGPGMDEATRKRIFEPFFTTKPPGSGTGLGLSVSYFIVTQDHKGSLAVVSQPGEGSRFIIELPVEGVSA